MSPNQFHLSKIRIYELPELTLMTRKMFQGITYNGKCMKYCRFQRDSVSEYDEVDVSSKRHITGDCHVS